MMWTSFFECTCGPPSCDVLRVRGRVGGMQHLDVESAPNGFTCEFGMTF